jgi:hypothetical protein
MNVQSQDLLSNEARDSIGYLYVLLSVCVRSTSLDANAKGHQTLSRVRRREIYLEGCTTSQSHPSILWLSLHTVIVDSVFEFEVTSSFVTTMRPL